MIVKKYTLVTSLIMSVIICFFVLSDQALALEEWEYEKPVIINNTTNPDTLTDYQVKLITDTASLIADGKMRSDCGDVRFSDSDKTTQLYYWIESGCNTNSTKIWVKVPLIPASSTKTIYMYYGNSLAASASSGENTFDFFDDFEPDSDKWSWAGDKKDGADAEYNYSTEDKGEAYSYVEGRHSWAKSWLTSDLIGSGEFELSLKIKANGHKGEHHTDYSHELSQISDSGSTILDSAKDIYYNWTEKTYHLTGNNLKLKLYAYAENGTGYRPTWSKIEVDDIIVRKYTLFEPTVNIGEEEVICKIEGEKNCLADSPNCFPLECCFSLICVDTTCRSCISKSCVADDAKDNSISEMGDSIDDVYCAWNIHDGCLVKSDIEIIDGGNNPDYWEGESCDAEGGSSDLWGEKKVYIDDINDYNIKGEVCVDDYNFFWINEVQANVLENGSVGCTGLQDVSNFFQTGWNTIKFKAVDTCSGNRYMDIDWTVTPRAPALNGIAGSSSTINLSWSDRGTGVTYFLYKFDSPGCYIYSGEDTEFTHTDLDANTTYSYQVKAVKNGAESDWSNSISATTWNQLPVADAGPDQFVVLGNSVNLNGSGSNDPDGDLISYDWTFNSIPAASSLTDTDFSDETIVNPSFTPDVIGVYLIELKVTDSYGGFHTDTVSITVANPTICGDNNIQCPNSSGLCEECDGTDDALCPGECVAPGEIRECLCPLLMPEWKEVKPKKE